MHRMEEKPNGECPRARHRRDCSAPRKSESGLTLDVNGPCGASSFVLFNNVVKAAFPISVDIPSSTRRGATPVSEILSAGRTALRSLQVIFTFASLSWSDFYLPLLFQDLFLDRSVFAAVATSFCSFNRFFFFFLLFRFEYALQLDS